MHNIQKSNAIDLESTKPLTQWVRPFVLKHLPNSTCDSNKIVDELIRVHSKELEMIDFYSNYHIPYKCTTFEEHIAFQISHLARSFIPTFRTNFSPFEPATRRREGRGILKNPSLTGQSSTGSANSSTSSMDEDSSSDDDSILENCNQNVFNADEKETVKSITFQTMFPPMKDVYRTGLKPPGKLDLLKYKKYTKMGKILMSNTPKGQVNRQKRSVTLVLVPANCYGEDNYRQTKPPCIRLEAIQTYEKYVDLPETVYNRTPTTADLNTISNYLNRTQDI